MCQFTKKNKETILLKSECKKYRGQQKILQTSNKYL